MTRDGQAQAHAAIPPCGRPLGLAELIKDPILLRDRDSQARVADANGDASPSVLDQQADPALGREFDGITQEVQDNLLQSRPIPLHTDRSVGDLALPGQSLVPSHLPPHGREQSNQN